MDSSRVSRRRRVVVTGLGCVSCEGLGTSQLWNGLSTPISNDGRIPPIDLVNLVGRKMARRADKWEQCAVISADEAVKMSGGLVDDTFRRGVFYSSIGGGLNTCFEQTIVFLENKPVSPFASTMWMPNAAAASISRKFRCQGPTRNILTACAGGTDAIIDAYRTIAHGYADSMIAGGGELPLVPPWPQSLMAAGTCSITNTSRPYDKYRDGLVMSEGSGVMVLESLDSALLRGSPILAEITGTGTTNDAHHVSEPLPDGSGMAQCISLALAEAQLAPNEVGWVNGHSAGTPVGDASEAAAIYSVFGETIQVSSNKGAIGHSFGGTGALEAIACVLSIKKELIPPTIGLECPDPTLPKLDFIYGEHRSWTPGHVMSINTALGNHNAAIIFSAYKD